MKLCFNLDDDDGDKKGDSDDDSKNDDASGRNIVVTIKMAKCSLPLSDSTWCLISTQGIVNIRKKTIYIGEKAGLY